MPGGLDAGQEWEYGIGLYRIAPPKLRRGSHFKQADSCGMPHPD